MEIGKGICIWADWHGTEQLILANRWLKAKYIGFVELNYPFICPSMHGIYGYEGWADLQTEHYSLHGLHTDDRKLYAIHQKLGCLC